MIAIGPRGTKRTLDDMSSEEQSSQALAAKTTPSQTEESCSDYGSRLTTKQRTVTAGNGPYSKTLHIHQSVLDSSPVLARQCASKDLEGPAPDLILRDERPDNFGILLEFLYSGKINSLCDDNKSLQASVEYRRKASEQLCQIYLLAEKYELIDMKNAVTEKFEAVTDLEKHPILFLEVARSMYQDIQSADKTYPTFFVKKVQILLEKPNVSKEVQTWIDGRAFSHERMSKDFFAAQNNRAKRLLENIKELR